MFSSLSKETNTDVLSVLKEDPEALARTQDGSFTMVRRRAKDCGNIEIACFYEGLPPGGVGMVSGFRS